MLPRGRGFLRFIFSRGSKRAGDVVWLVTKSPGHALVEVYLDVAQVRYMNIKKDKKKRKKKRTALVVCRDRKEFWTTQAQFWQWVREGVVIKTGDNPLTGAFNREHEELMVLLSNTVLNLAHPNHLREALASRRIGMAGK
jgi:hypothetical protein